MKNSVFFISLLIFSFLFGCKTEKNIVSTYQSDIKIDGNLNDWKNKLEFNASTDLYYGIANDDRNLFIALKTYEPIVKRKIVAFGLTVWFNDKGNKEHSKGIVYPVMSERKNIDFHSMHDKGRRPLANTNKMELINFNGKEMDEVSIFEESDVKVSIKNYKNTPLVYEAKIPLKDIFRSINSFNDKINIGFETGNIDLPRKNSIKSPTHNRYIRNGVYGMRPPYRSNRNPGRNGPVSNFEKMKSPTILWLKNVQIQLTNEIPTD